MKLLWGDIHNHCGITYGYGGLENAMAAAKEQLDFCTVTGHAMWEDIPERTKELEYLVDYHKNGFAKLKQNWESVKNVLNDAKSDDFITFLGYEMHSSYYGDHHILSTSEDLPLIDSASPRELIENVKPSKAITVPHHVGYTPNYRGANWDTFDNVISPVIEVYSKHGCSMSEDSAYDYLHTMGPKDGRSTIFAGLKQGKRFGFIASTDHHAGYPGSYGDGRMAVWAEAKTKEAIFDAIVNRRTYAVTGDKIQCSFDINGSPMGSEIIADKREISFDVKACDYIDRIILYKNTVPFKIYNFPVSDLPNCRFKVRIELGWGHEDEGYDWDVKASVDGGSLVGVETCFRGRSVLAPSEKMSDNDNINKLNNKILSRDEHSAHFVCNSVKNQSTLHSSTQAVILEVDGNKKTMLKINVNGKTIYLTIEQLLESSYTEHMKAYNSEAIKVHRAVPQSHYCFSDKTSDTGTGNDIYHLEVRQCNNQYAWVSPIFVDMP